MKKKDRTDVVAIFDYNNRTVKIFNVKDIPANMSIEEWMRSHGYDMVNYAWIDNVKNISIEL